MTPLIQQSVDADVPLKYWEIIADNLNIFSENLQIVQKKCLHPL